MIRHKTKYLLVGVLSFTLCLVWMLTTGMTVEAATGTAEEPVEEPAEVPVEETDVSQPETGRSDGTGTTQNAGEMAMMALPFTDLTRYQWEDGKKAIRVMSQSKIINGFPDGTFRPSELITRRQAAKIVAMAAGLPAAPADFVDVDPQPSYIGALQQAGIVSGDQAGRFRPDDSLTRAQLAKMIVLAYGLEMKEEPQLSDVPDTDLGQYVRIAASNGIMTGYEDGTFRPNQPVKRDQAAVMIYRAMQLAGVQLPGDVEDGSGGENPGEDANDGVGTPDGGEGLLPGQFPWSLERPFRLFVDAGHGGEDPGAVGKLPDGSPIREKDINLDIALEIVRIFREEYAFVEVMMSRSEDIFIMLQERSRLANEWGADYFVSIHVNANDKPSASGFESYIYNGPVTQETVDKQRIIHQYIVEKMGLRDRGPKSANFAVLRESKMPAILLENLFISNPEEAVLLNDPEFRQRLARATAEAIALAWNVPRYDELSTEPPLGGNEKTDSAETNEGDTAETGDTAA